MKFATSTVLTDYAGKPIVVGDSDEKLTVAFLIRESMNAGLPGEPWTPDTLLRCAELSRRAQLDPAEYDDDDRAFIKDRAAKVFGQSGTNGPLFYSLLHSALNSENALVDAPPGAD